jgi:hypothetical protein
MGKNTNLPFHLYVNVNNRALGPNMPDGTTKAIWHGVYSREYQLIMCHVFLETGAHWSGLPLHAISTTENFSLPIETLMPWACMGEDVETFYSTFLEGLVVKTKNLTGRHTGIILDWKDGYSRYPQEHKPLNMIEMQNGQYAFLPNNYLVFSEKHFVDEKKKDELKNYRRGETIYWEI